MASSNGIPVAFTDIVGRGWLYPFAFDPRTGGVAKDDPPSPLQRLQRILMAVQQVLGVKRGTRFMSRKFGSTVRELIFKPNDAPIVGLVQFAVTDAIETWEKRVQLNNVDVEPDPDLPVRVLVAVDYTIRRTNVQGNLVWPLYLGDSERAVAETGLQQ